jgi:hypothetical protein
MTEPGTDPFPPSIETPTAQLYGTVALLFGALVRQTELTAALKRTKADNARLRAELTKAADSLDWADAHLEDAGVVSANVRYGARDARAALNTGKETK